MDNVLLSYHFNAKDFREECDNNARSIFHYYATRQPLRYSIASVVVFICLYFIVLQHERLAWLLVINAVVIVALFTHTIIKAGPYFTWRKSVNDYLVEQQAFSINFFEVTENTIKQTTDDIININRWDKIKAVLIHPGFISFTNSEQQQFSFIAKSMQPGDFEKLKSLVEEKMKQS